MAKNKATKQAIEAATTATVINEVATPTAEVLETTQTVEPNEVTEIPTEVLETTTPEMPEMAVEQPESEPTTVVLELPKKVVAVEKALPEGESKHKPHGKFGPTAVYAKLPSPLHCGCLLNLQNEVYVLEHIKASARQDSRLYLLSVRTGKLSKLNAEATLKQVSLCNLKLADVYATEKYADVENHIKAQVTKSHQSWLASSKQ